MKITIHLLSKTANNFKNSKYAQFAQIGLRQIMLNI